MPGEATAVMGLFADEDTAAATIKAMGATDWHLERVHSPIPSHKIAHALKPAKSKVGWFTLGGGIIGFFTGFGLASFTALRWSMIVGGKPVVALVPFFIVGFEFTILFAVFGNVIGLISQMGLPRGMKKRYDPRLSGNRFGLLATCAPRQKAELIAFFKDRGAEIREFEPVSEGAQTMAGATT
jgi:molybdopterin-containing oxidoreductase family membrane subunit